VLIAGLPMEEEERGLGHAAVIARLLHDSLRETLEEGFVRTARAKGLSERALIYRHALRVAVLPVISYLGPLAANLLTGSIVVETVFHIPGAGGFFVNSILNRDGFLLGGVVIVYCVLLMFFNLVVDVSYRLLDRRICD
jgi:oligopeptide transport system permease protein